MRQHMWLCLECGTAIMTPRHHATQQPRCCDHTMYYNGSVTSPLCQPKETLEPKTDP